MDDDLLDNEINFISYTVNQDGEVIDLSLQLRREVLTSTAEQIIFNLMDTTQVEISSLDNKFKDKAFYYGFTFRIKTVK